MKTNTVTTKHWEGEKVEFDFQVGESLEEALKLHNESEVLYAYQQGAKVIYGTRLRAVCAKSTGGVRSAPAMNLEEVQDWMAAGIPLAPARVSKTDNQKYADYLNSLSPEERAVEVSKLQEMITPAAE